MNPFPRQNPGHFRGKHSQEPHPFLAQFGPKSKPIFLHILAPFLYLSPANLAGGLCAFGPATVRRGVAPHPSSEPAATRIPPAGHTMFKNNKNSAYRIINHKAASERAAAPINARRRHEDGQPPGSQEKKRSCPFVFFLFLFILLKIKKKRKKTGAARGTPAQRGSYFPVAATGFLPLLPASIASTGGAIGGLSSRAPVSGPRVASVCCRASMR